MKSPLLENQPMSGWAQKSFIGQNFELQITFWKIAFSYRIYIGARESAGINSWNTFYKDEKIEDTLERFLVNHL